MEHNRKQKLFVILILFVAIASLSVGFAAFSMSLNVSSSASVTPNSDTFSVKFSKETGSTIVDGEFDAYEVSEGATASKGIIDNSGNPKIKNLSATFTEPGQKVTYLVYLKNMGSYAAYLNSINFLGEKKCIAAEGTSDALVQSACDSITISVRVGTSGTYYSTSSTTGLSIPARTSYWAIMRIYLSYDLNGGYVDGPFSVYFPNLALVYSTVDDSSIEPTIARIESGDLNTPGSIVSIGNEQFYVIGQENGNVKLLSMYNLHVGNRVDENWNVTPLASPTGIQDSSARGFVNNEFPLIGTTAFSDTSTSYSGSIVEEYVNSYKTYLTNMGVDVSTARLITEEELKTLGCNREARTCSGAPSWVYATSYWMDLVDDPGYVGVVSTILDFGITNSFNNSSNLGVRPVIEIPLSEFE